MINKSGNAPSLSLPPTHPGKAVETKNKCLRAVTLDDTMIKNISYYHKLGALISFSSECLQEKEK